MNSLFRASRCALRQWASSVRNKMTLPPSATGDMPDYYSVPEGEKVQHMFSDQEFDQRLAKLRQHMRQEGIEATLLTSYHNINYYSGFMYCYFGRNYGLLVTDDDTCVISSLIDYMQPYRRSRANHGVMYTDWSQDNYWKAISHLLRDTKGKIGFESDDLSVDNMQKLQQVAGTRQTVDVGKPTMRMRLIKSPEEHHVITEGARICDLGEQVLVDTLRSGGEGTPEHEVALAVQGALIRESAKTFPMNDIMDTWCWFQSGLNTDGAHNPVTTRKVVKGDILSGNCFPMIQGYYIALERTFFYDHCDDASRRIWDINVEVYRRGCELIKPGATCKGIALELNEIYRKYDVLKYRTFGYGHSFGSLSHYYGREAGLELREDVETVIEPGMVVSMEPMLTVPAGQPGAGGYREHDIFIVTDSGATNITGFPVGPEHNIIK